MTRLLMLTMLGAMVLPVGSISAAPYVSDDSLPHYRGNYCWRLARVVERTAEFRQACRDAEASAVESLKVTWPYRAPEPRSRCDSVARVYGGTYHVLASCLDVRDGAVRPAKGRITK